MENKGRVVALGRTCLAQFRRPQTAAVAWLLLLPLPGLVMWSLFQGRFTPVWNAENQRMGWFVVGATLAPLVLAAAGLRAPRFAAVAAGASWLALALELAVAAAGVFWLVRAY